MCEDRSLCVVQQLLLSELKRDKHGIHQQCVELAAARGGSREKTPRVAAAVDRPARRRRAAPAGHEDADRRAAGERPHVLLAQKRRAARPRRARDRGAGGVHRRDGRRAGPRARPGTPRVPGAHGRGRNALVRAAGARGPRRVLRRAPERLYVLRGDGLFSARAGGLFWARARATGGVGRRGGEGRRVGRRRGAQDRAGGVAPGQGLGPAKYRAASQSTTVSSR